MEALIRLRDHGVTPEYVQELKALGYDRLAIEDLGDAARPRADAGPHPRRQRPRRHAPADRHAEVDPVARLAGDPAAFVATRPLT